MKANNSLAKLARTLEKVGPGAKGETLSELWKLLVTSIDDEYHAAEETILRWLLKIMNGPATKSQAEIMRRYPLAWSILEQVFSRIPLFSLAKSLADRKFITILQLALKNISESAVSSHSHKSGKRKRSHEATFDLEALKDTDCALDGAQALIGALTTLASRLKARGLSTRDFMGAEHIKSLFASSATDSLAIVAPILKLAFIHLSTSIDSSNSPEKWIHTMSAIWDLHRIGNTDAIEAATQTSLTVLQLIHHLNSRTYSSTENQNLDTISKISWKQALESFYTRAVIFPARTAFLTAESTEILDAVLSAIHPDALICAPVFYTLSIDTSDSNINSLKNRESWQCQLFLTVKMALDSQYSLDKPVAMKLILDIAKDRETSICRESLENVCRNYVLGADSTEWTVLVRVLACDRHVIFQSWGQILLADEICRRASAIKSDDAYGADDIQQVVREIRQAYAETRNLKAFWQLWYVQLCACEANNVLETSPWLGDALRYDTSIVSSIESHMTPNQLSDLLQWLAMQEPVCTGPQFILLDAITSQINLPDFTDPIAIRIANLVLKNLTWTPALPSLKKLRWSILSKIVAWISPEERDQIWTSVKAELTGVLIEGSLSDPDVIEAFTFLDRLWLSMYPDGEKEADVSSLALKVAKHLAKVGSKKMKKSDNVSAPVIPYLDIAIKTSSRLIPLLAAKSDDFPKFIRKNIINHESLDGATFEYMTGLIANENIINNRKLIESLISSLISILFSDYSDSFDSRSSAISILARIPDDCFSRAQRESVMKTSMAFLTKNSIHDPSLWKIALHLMKKMMKRSTFYEGICFDNLVSLADAASICFRNKDEARLLKEVYGLDFLFSSLASAIIKQMTTHYDEWGRIFLADVKKFMKGCNSEAEYLLKHHIRIVLLQTLINTIRSITLKDEDAFDMTKAEKLLLSMLKALIIEYQSDSSIGHSFPYAILSVIDASRCIQESVAEVSKIKVKKLEPLASAGVTNGTLLGWKLREFLLRTQHDPIRTVPVQFISGAFSDLSYPDTLEPTYYRVLVNDTIDAITSSLKGTNLLSYFHSLIDNLTSAPDTCLQLEAINCCVTITSQATKVDIEDKISVASAYSKLIQVALSAPNGQIFIKICETLRAFLVSHATHLKQWNIEQTLSFISDVSSGTPSVSAVRNHPMVYTWLCKLMEIIIRRFRLRLEGRFHLLIATLQSLLSGLLLMPYDSHLGKWSTQSVSIRDGDFSHWGQHAAAFTRLLTLVCEPMAASVARHKQNTRNALDTAADIAKRAAGRQMYLIMVSYVKLQLQVDVPRDVRDALELGMNSIFDITPPEVRKILNDSLDVSGRAILGTQYKRYRQFGKWSGV